MFKSKDYSMRDTLDRYYARYGIKYVVKAGSCFKPMAKTKNDALCGRHKMSI